MSEQYERLRAQVREEGLGLRRPREKCHSRGTLQDKDQANASTIQMFADPCSVNRAGIGKGRAECVAR